MEPSRKLAGKGTLKKKYDDLYKYEWTNGQWRTQDGVEVPQAPRGVKRAEGVYPSPPH